MFTCKSWLGSLPSVQPNAHGTWWQAVTRNPAYTKTCISRTRDWSWLSLVNENQERPGRPRTNVIPQRVTLAKTDKPLNAQQRISFTDERSWLHYLYRINIICSNVFAKSWISKLALIHSRESPSLHKQLFFGVLLHEEWKDWANHN